MESTHEASQVRLGHTVAASSAHYAISMVTFSWALGAVRNCADTSCSLLEPAGTVGTAPELKQGSSFCSLFCKLHFLPSWEDQTLQSYLLLALKTLWGVKHGFCEWAPRGWFSLGSVILSHGFKLSLQTRKLWFLLAFPIPCPGGDEFPQQPFSASELPWVFFLYFMNQLC